MKISEYKNLNWFLTLLFTFFEENSILPSRYAMDDYDRLLERILDSEFNSINCYPGIYEVDFKLKERIEDAEIYLFVLNSNDNSHSSHLLIDLGEKELISFFSFSWDEEKLPPYMNDFIDENGNLLPDINPDKQDLYGYEIMTFDEFIIYLNNSRKPGHFNMIVVD